MNWNKLKKQLEEFINPSIVDQISYSQSGYQYTGDKKNQNHILVNKMEVLNTREVKSGITWYENEMAVKKDPELRVYIEVEEIEAIKIRNPNIPEDRLHVIAQKNKVNEVAKTIFLAQQNLLKSDFKTLGAKYLNSSVDTCLTSDDILLNIFGIMDRRVGKNRLKKMSKEMACKHPAVKYFYQLRIEG